MQYVKAPDGRMDMKYAIYRLEKIRDSEVSDEDKLMDLHSFISELQGTLSRSGQCHQKAPIIY